MELLPADIENAIKGSPDTNADACRVDAKLKATAAPVSNNNRNMILNHRIANSAGYVGLLVGKKMRQAVTDRHSF